MVQGKFKKTQLPAGLKKKAKLKQGTKGGAFTRRANAPVQVKKSKLTEQEKIQSVITKSLNRKVESEMRSLVADDNINLSKAQRVVADHHQKQMPAKL